MPIDHPSFGTLDDDRVIIFDTTLRDGEQSPGFSMNLHEKLRMAEALTELGVDVMEAGFPIASQGDFEAVRAIAETIHGPVICGLARTGREDIARCAEAIRPAERKRIHTFVSTSPLHMKYKLRMEPEAVLEMSTKAVEFARGFTDDVEWSAEDGSRTEEDFLCRCVEAAIKAGATTINIPDTVGYALPEDLARIFIMLRERVPGADRVIFSTHNHNDLGLAVANTLAAIRAGVRQVECTINGIGERAGNASLEEAVMAIRTRHDAIPMKTGINTPNILRTSKLLALGYGEIGDNQLNVAFKRFKDLADRKKIVYDDDIVALVDDEVVRDHERIRFVSLEVRSGSKATPHAALELEVDGELRVAEADGDGPVDATFKAIQAIFPHTATLAVFSVGAGTDAQARTTVRLEEDGKMVDGQGADTCTITASARAYVHALNKLLVKRARTAPAALTA